MNNLQQTVLFSYNHQTATIHQSAKWLGLYGIVHGLLFAFMATRGLFLEYARIGGTSIIIAAAFLLIVYLTNSDYIITMLCLLLLAIGDAAQTLVGNRNTSKLALIQFIAAISGIIIGRCLQWMLASINHKVLIFILILFSIAVLGILFVKGVNINGTRAWVMLPGLSIQIQATEFVKLAVIVMFALIFSDNTITEQRKFLYSVLITGLFLALFAMIRELGTVIAIITLMLAFVFMFLDKIRYFIWTIIVIAGMAISGYSFLYICHRQVLKSQQVSMVVNIGSSLWNKIHERISLLVELDKLDQTGVAYQTVTARKAVRLGGWLGSEYKVTVPAADNDFVFCSIIQGMGMLIAILVIIIFVCVLIQGLKLVYTAKNITTSCLIYGFTLSIFSQSLLTIFGSTNFFLLMGMPIAFISDGGANMTLCFAMLSYILFSSGGE